jgi:hypothetical protein
MNKKAMIYVNTDFLLRTDAECSEYGNLCAELSMDETSVSFIIKTKEKII